MHKYITTKSGRRIVLNTPEEDAKITQVALANPDAQLWSDEQLEAIRPFTRVGRPLGSGKKTPVTLRLDTDVLEGLRATGKGWQTRVNDVMREWLKQRV